MTRMTFDSTQACKCTFFAPLMLGFIAFFWCLSMNKKWEKIFYTRLDKYAAIAEREASAIFSIKRNLCQAPLTKCTKVDRISSTFIM